MLACLRSKSAGRQPEEKIQEFPKSVRKDSRLRKFARRVVRFFSQPLPPRLSWTVRQLDRPEDSFDFLKYEWNNFTKMPRAESPTSKQFLHMSEVIMENGYMLGPKIGSGSYAKVRLVERISDGKILAAKVIDREKAPADYVQDFMPRELEIVQSIKHEHVAQVQEIIETDKSVFIIMDYAQKGDLLEHIMNNGAPKEKETKKMFRQIVSAVNYLHEIGVVHRDLKCENILIKKNMDIIISDFGFSRRFDQNNKPSKTFCGSAAYASPQLIKGTPYDPRQNDVWSLGCILFILTCGSMPFDDSNIKKMVQRQKDGVCFPSKVKDKINPDVKALIKRILEPDTTKRYTTTDILNNIWLCSQTESKEDEERAQPFSLR
ncbi:testis-specific serine/threonine-protein kinase 3-like [Haliotis rufescens]|uniref:testis-specific serine/threonine-protein kinase 3-like n=1 Tax=Haliotis rufescens TaxID=6454 RepID=UPI001EAFF990|nr:testis-specific serine/threonine-protein kinase 3-like [Haliotis rufescens]